ncbi:ras guanine nucleotide exchange factor domain-containing protein [Zopfochytrium polystomum]|nr:ras guanine nucleotide exchange factor domain-containing protein [Zopfochytrium polystomum]
MASPAAASAVSPPPGASAVVVTALFDFNALDESGLSFKAGDVIHVHNQLVSGWWDGTCNGARGWFPCNYVTRPDQAQTPEEEATTWVRQIAQDGTIYYVNRFTGEASFPAPASGGSFDSLQGSPRPNESPRDSTSLQSATLSAGGRSSSGSTLILPPGWTSFKADDGAFVYYHSETKETSWVPPPGTMAAPLSPQAASSPASDSVRTVNGRPVSSISTLRAAAMSEGLPPNWGKKLTADGKIYYYNIVTDETIWDINDVNPETGELKLRSARPASSVLPGTLALEDGRRSQDSDPARLTWSHLINSVTVAIQTLEGSAVRNQRERFIPQSSAIVESIRVMLFASGTARRDAPQSEAHRPLRAHYRTIMATLSTLVMAAKLASSVWPPPDAVSRMQAATAEVLTAVQNFVAAAQEAGVEIRAGAVPPAPNLSSDAPQSVTTPVAAPETMQVPSISPSPSQQQALHRTSVGGPAAPHTGRLTYGSNSNDAVVPGETPSFQVVLHLENFTNSIVGMITALNQAIHSGTCDSAKLISDVRQIVMEVGNFLSIVDDIPLDSLSEDVTVDFKVNRLSLYNSISGLVMATSTATGQFPPSNAVEQVIVSTGLVEKAVKDLLITTKFVIQEREQREQSTFQEYMSGQNYAAQGASAAPRASLQSSYSSGMQGYSAYASQSPLLQQPGYQTYSPHASFNQMPASQAQLISATQSMSISADVHAMYAAAAAGRSASFDQSGYLSGDRNSYGAQTGFAEVTELDPEDPLGLMRSPANRQSRKLTKVLGAEVIPIDVSLGGTRPEDAAGGSATTPTSAPASGSGAPTAAKPWYLQYDYSPSDIVLNAEGRVKGGKLPALVERLTMHDAVDNFYVQAFLLTYRSFTTTPEFFDLLKKRFLLQAPALNEIELEEWTRAKKKPICFRVFNVMKLWLETYYQDDEEDRAAVVDLKSFATTAMQDEDGKLGLSLSKELVKLVERRGQGLMKKVLKTMGKDAPPPILPRTLKRIKFLEIDALEIARQLTIIEAKMYNKIQPVEFLRKAFSDKEPDPAGKPKAPNVKAMITMSNQVSGWVAQGILSEKDQAKRKKLIMHFISIAEKCRTLNNFNTLMAILAGLNTSSIHRLRRTWELVPPRNLQIFETLRETMDSTKNFSRYRETLHSINPPCVPFLGFYLTDLTFIEDGSPNFLKSQGDGDLINFAKRMKTSEVIREVQQYQNVPYLFTPVHELQEFLTESFEHTVDEGDLYNLSLQLEPRER